VRKQYQQKSDKSRDHAIFTTLLSPSPRRSLFIPGFMTATNPSTWR